MNTTEIREQLRTIQKELQDAGLSFPTIESLMKTITIIVVKVREDSFDAGGKAMEKSIMEQLRKQWSDVYSAMLKQ